MPNKTIYVPDADLRIFDHAQDVSGKNLSATIVQALRYFVKIGEGKGFVHIEVSEGSDGLYKRKRFIGRELASASVSEGNNRVTDYIVYETAHGNYAVYKTTERRLSLEESIEKELEKRIIERFAGKDIAHSEPSKTDDSKDVRTLEIFHSIDELNGKVPGDLIRSLQEIEDGEFLDI
ncbi:MAG: EXLDI protein [Sporolactobacillus sp.]|jgi:EXLDI family protein|nr:EXLDI protein [Sporolactobacillus sp.]MCI1882021.1 EXLDI protein [Sporolactobacillus sp.]